MTSRRHRRQQFFDTLCEKLKNNVPFACSRWGDGEWTAVAQNCKPGASNTDGNFYYPDLGKRLRSIVSKKRSYYMTAQRGQCFSLSDKYEQDWEDASFLHHFNRKGKLGPFLEILKKVCVVYVGNKSLGRLPFIDWFIEIPYLNVWRGYGYFLKRIKKLVNNKKHKVFLFSAGMVSEVFIHDLWAYNKNNTYLDVGSIFDPYVGRLTRRYHQNNPNFWRKNIKYTLS